MTDILRGKCRAEVIELKDRQEEQEKAEKKECKKESSKLFAWAAQVDNPAVSAAPSVTCPENKRKRGPSKKLGQAQN